MSRQETTGCYYETVSHGSTYTAAWKRLTRLIVISEWFAQFHNIFILIYRFVVGTRARQLAVAMAVVIEVGKEQNSVDLCFQALPCESRNRDCSLITVIRVLVDDRRNHGEIRTGAVFFSPQRPDRQWGLSNFRA